MFARCVLPSLRETASGDVEVVVVDQSETLETARLIKDLPSVRRVESGPGLSRGRNVGVAATSAPIVVFADDDVEFGPGWLTGIRALFDDPAVGVVCGRGVDSDGRPLPHRAAGTYRWPTSPFGLGHGFNLAFRRAALEDAGPFDEELGAGARVPAAEDTDMIYRAMRSGWTAVCDDGIGVVHHSWRAPREQLAAHRAYGMGFAAQTLKHARAGDAAAIRIAFGELARQLGWALVALARRDRGGLRCQWQWARGAAAGLARGVRAPSGLRDVHA